MKVDLNEKVALVTGSTRGIGEAIALAFAENGADIILNSNEPGGAEQVAAEIEKRGRKVTFIQADVGNNQQVTQMVQQAIDALGRIDILVNNAGIGARSGRRVPIHEFSEEAWEEIVNIDLDGVFFCSKQVSQRMIAQGGGKIINISSVAGIVPLRLQIAYCAAKAGVVNLTRGMALELAPYNINVNAIAPGSTVTQGTRELFYSDDPEKKKLAESLLSHVPLKRPGTPQDIANAALYLASAAADYVTGHILVVDGGWICGYNRDW